MASRDHEIERPPHWQQGPEQRTPADAPPDYPAATEIPSASEAAEDRPLHVLVDNQQVPRRDIQDWAAYQLFVDDARLVKVAGRNKNRRRLVITNHDNTTAVFIGRNRADSTSAMYELHAGTNGVERPTLELFHHDEVWAVCGDSDSVTLSVVSEFVPHTD